MHNSKKSKTPTPEVRKQLKHKLSLLDSRLKRLKVKPYYNNGKVTAHADLGIRRICVKSHYSTAFMIFKKQYNERVLSAF